MDNTGPFYHATKKFIFFTKFKSVLFIPALACGLFLYSLSVLASNFGGFFDGNNYYGGTSSNRATQDAELRIGGMVIGRVAAGFSNTGGNVINNKVEVEDGAAVTLDVFGGKVDGNAINTANFNQAIVNGGTMRYLTGGGAMSNDYAAAANNNSLIVNGGTMRDSVVGGDAFSNKSSAAANNNSIIITNGTMSNNVTGGVAYTGISTSTATADNNSITITGGKINRNIVGGNVYVYNGSTFQATATHNTVTISGSPTLSNVNTTIYGGNSSNSANVTDLFTENTFNLYSKIAVKGVKNFEFMNFYLPSDIANGDTMLEVTDAVKLEESRPVKIGINFVKKPSVLKVGDSIVLISNVTDFKNQTSHYKSLTTDYEFGLNVDSNNKLMAELTSMHSDEEGGKNVEEGVLGTASLISSAGGFVANTGMIKANIAANNSRKPNAFGTFGVFSGGSNRYNTGSHVDVNYFNLMTGVSKHYNQLLLGGFFEGGYGAYKAYNGGVKGKGDSEYYGVGMLAKYNFNPAYIETSLRLGYVSHSYESSDFVNVDYKQGSLYYGGHIGAGYIFSASRLDIDFFTKMFFTHQNGYSKILANQKYDAKAFNSLSGQVGTKLTYNFSQAFTPYVSLAYEYEFLGKSKAIIDGEKLKAAPSLRGSTGVGGIGLEYAISDYASLDFSVNGYIGKKKGVSGNFGIRFEF